MPTTRVQANGVIVPLESRAANSRALSTSDAQDPAKLATELIAIRDDVSDITRRHNPKSVDFEDVACPGNPGTVRLPHGLNGRVRWWIVEWNSNGSAWFLDASHYFVGPSLSKNAATDANTLVLDSYFAGTATIRVEAAG